MTILPQAIDRTTPYPQPPWELSNKARAKLKGVMFKRDALDPTDPDSALVCQLLAHTDSSGLGIRRIRVIENPLPYLRKALELKRQIHGKKHPAVATRINNIGTALQALDRTGETLSWMKQAQKLYRPISITNTLTSTRIDNVNEQK